MQLYVNNFVVSINEAKTEVIINLLQSVPQHDETGAFVDVKSEYVCKTIMGIDCAKDLINKLSLALSSN